MATVNVLIVVDVESALSFGLQGNVYMVDTNKNIGPSLNEGQVELYTVLGEGDTVIWSVAPIDPGTNVSICGFTGAATNGNISPVLGVNGTWSSMFDATTPYTSGNQYQYSVTLQYEGTTGPQQSFDPFLQCR